MFMDWRTPVYGCGYVYDGVPVGGSLIDCCGVKMLRRPALECTVEWGRDRVYEELFTTSMDYKSFSNIVCGTEVLEDYARSQS